MKQLQKRYKEITKEVKISLPLWSLSYTSLVFAVYLFSLCCIPPEAEAGAGTTGANFLRIGPGARQAAMAEAATGVADDAVAGSYNPAALASLKEVELHFMHLAYWQNVNYEFVTFGTKLGPNQGLGWDFAILDAGKMDELQEDASGSTYTKVGTITFQNILVGVTYADALTASGEFTWGGKAKAIMEQAASESRFGVALDLGAVLKRDRYQLGLSILNLGPSFGASALPLTVRAGFSSSTNLLTNFYKDLLIGFDAVWPVETGKIKASFGAELWLINLVAARAGYKTGSDVEGMTFGAGFKVAGDQLTWALDYAFVPSRDDLGTSHRFELLLKFVLK